MFLTSVMSTLMLSKGLRETYLNIKGVATSEIKELKLASEKWNSEDFLDQENLWNREMAVAK